MSKQLDSGVKSGEVVPRRSDAEWADVIRADLAATAQGIIDAGKHLAQAKEQVGHSGWLDWLARELRMSNRTAQMYMAIARHPVLSNAKHASLLPASWYTLYVLSRASDGQLARAIEAGVVTPDMDRREAEKWIEVQRVTGLGLARTSGNESRQRLSRNESDDHEGEPLPPRLEHPDPEYASMFLDITGPYVIDTALSGSPELNPLDDWGESLGKAAAHLIWPNIALAYIRMPGERIPRRKLDAKVAEGKLTLATDVARHLEEMGCLSRPYDEVTRTRPYVAGPEPFMYHPPGQSDKPRVPYVPGTATAADQEIAAKPPVSAAHAPIGGDTSEDSPSGNQGITGDPLPDPVPEPDAEPEAGQQVADSVTKTETTALADRSAELEKARSRIKTLEGELARAEEQIGKLRAARPDAVLIAEKEFLADQNAALAARVRELEAEVARLSAAPGGAVPPAPVTAPPQPGTAADDGVCDGCGGAGAAPAWSLQGSTRGTHAVCDGCLGKARRKFPGVVFSRSELPGVPEPAGAGSAYAPSGSWDSL